MGISNYVPGTKRDSHGGCDTDGRSPADHHAPYGLGDILEIMVGVVDFLARQAGLVNHDHGIIAPFDSAEGHIRAPGRNKV